MLAQRMYQFLGFFFLALAILGIFLPLLPTTPFVLVAAACFARSSEKWHAWLLGNSTFGPMIRNWESNRCITRKVKVVAIASMLVVGGFSVFFAVDDRVLRIAGGLLITTGLVVVARTKTCKPDGRAEISTTAAKNG
jgi:uncharacterized membrane protein YbaN (DUF454 family)